MKETVTPANNLVPAQPSRPVHPAQPPIGIDIGGTKINAAIVLQNESRDESQIASLIHSPTPTESQAFLDTLVSMIRQLHEQHQVSAVGIATAGVVDSIHGRILGSTGNMPALRGIANLKELLEDKTGLSVHVENDANAAAYGEWCSGAAAGARNMFAITLGTGVGMGIVFDGKMYRGSHFYAAEGGHIAIGHNHERQCTCGRWDCWEIFASGTGLKITAEQVVAAASEPSRHDFLNRYGKNNEVTTYAVMEGFSEANPLSTRILDLWHGHIAVGLGSLINVMDPDIIVVGGGLAQFVDFEKLNSLTRERAMSMAFNLVPARLGNYAGIVGAAQLALEALSPA